MQSPQWMHRALVSGLWQYLQSRLQACKKIAVRFPGPSTELKGIILFTGTFISARPCSPLLSVFSIFSCFSIFFCFSFFTANSCMVRNSSILLSFAGCKRPNSTILGEAQAPSFHFPLRDVMLPNPTLSGKAENVFPQYTEKEEA